MRRPSPAALFLPLSLLAGACVAAPADDVTTPPCTGKCDGAGGVGDSDGDGTSVCLAIRGNGPRITAHFGVLARVLEHYGLVDGVAGGSSGSISAFFLDSVQLNPAVHTCGEGACSPAEQGERAAFLFKALRGYIEVLTQTEEALAFGEVSELARAIQQQDLAAVLEADPAAGVTALRTLFGSPGLRALINPELLELLETSPDPAAHARDLVATLSRGLSFTAEAPTIFVRPGAVHFTAFIDKLGRVGTFLAGGGPVEERAMIDLLDACAPAARGATWATAAAIAYDGATCGARFGEQVARWRDLERAGSYPSRLDTPVGAHLPALVTTGVLEGAAIAAWDAARADYLAARPVELDVDYADVGVGYWGAPADLALIEAGGQRRTDLKSSKRRALGAASWRTALAASPAEPGLSRGVELADGRISVGGWSDLQPVLVLEDLGCDETVFVTREGGAGSFETGISELLGIDEAEAHALFSLDDPASSYYQAIEEAAGVWCADWDAPAVQDLDAMTAVGYDAPLETTSAYLTGGAAPYDNIVERTGIAGCTLGVP